MCNSDENWEKEADYVSMALSERMAGVLIAPKTRHADVSSLLARGTAVVAIDRSLDADVDQIVFDNRSLGKLATADLLQRGYRRICCISGPIETSTSADRAMGWRDAMTEAGLNTDGLLQYANFRVDGGREATRKLLGSKPTPDALVATNNLVGVGALQMLGELGFEDLGLAVIGELPFATSHHPNAKYVPLTPRAMGEEGARMLLARISAPEHDRTNVILPLPEPRALTW
ncbi:substrate-binding domain-containing protein [Paenarthrobacter nicotinovorans]|uniref:substrate-binding domain-containing protein n=1 Tax=Paenarthrobacter nicotinovorans TaxID=29320 RepID=UPI00382B9198